ncbi:laccase [Auriculariales sp. MPI-PUGE-AT-0066]|nr:laccase [Auriculariales sp. MPI-PUGE-AT-0066]
MRFDILATLVAAAVPIAGSRHAERIEDINLVARQGQSPPPVGCINAVSKLCWDGTHNITTNYYTTGPRTGRVVTVNFDVRNVTLAPDGRSRQVLAINGQIPGPTIVANWGDTIKVNVKNSLQHNGTNIHWHGIRMLKNFKNDGANGVTECPIAPGQTKTYTFVAEQYGTTWYHSHYSAQYGDGVWGAVQINGPATAEYDIDLGPITVSDWFALQTAYQKAYSAERTGPPVPDNFLVNGINVNPGNTTQGTRYKLKFTPGRKHRLRFINTSVDTFFRVSLDGHNMTVIQTDMVPVTPFQVQSVGLAIGQRYDVIITANTAAPANYWLRTYPQAACGRNTNDGTGDANAYVSYTGAPSALPSSTPWTVPTGCTDETGVVPYVPITIDASVYPTNNTQLNVSAPFAAVVNNDTVFRWNIGNALPVGMNIDWSNPSVKYLEQNQTLPAELNSYYISGNSSTVYFVIQNQAPIPHPIHLHLHDFNVIAQGTGTFDPSTTTVNWVNPMRRDVAMLPASGYLFIAFKADNPGIALMHCHIAWHVSEGLSLQLVERASEIFGFTTLDAAWTNTCTTWDAWYTSSANVYGVKSDSGLRTRPT